MDLLKTDYINLINRLRRSFSSVTIKELSDYFDKLVQFIKNQTYSKENTDVFELLHFICIDLPSIYTLRSLNHSILINHSIFIYLRQTFEMLLTKSNHSNKIPMNKHEENCFYSISYFLTQLCLEQNQSIESFYTLISQEILPVTDKINQRDPIINESNRKSKPITNKLNTKVCALSPSAPTARPIEEQKFDITKISRLKKFPEKLIKSSIDSTIKISNYPIISTDHSSKKYQDIILTDSLLQKLARAIEDLSQNDYSSFHVKYKVVNRFVQLCTQLHITDTLLAPIMKCLRSKFYRQQLLVTKQENFHIDPKRLFFIYTCSQFFTRNQFERSEQIANLLTPTMIEVTKPIIDLLTENENNYYNHIHLQIVRLALKSHFEILLFLSISLMGRRHFLQSSIIDQILDLLQNYTFSYNHSFEEEFLNPDAQIISNALMLLCNLSYEQQIFTKLKEKDLQIIYSKYQSKNDNSVEFTLKTLAKILKTNEINEDNDPKELQIAYIEYIDRINIKSKEIRSVDTEIDLTKRRIRPKKREKIDETSEDEINKKKKNKIVDTSLEKLINDIEVICTTTFDSSNKPIYKDVSRRLRVYTKLDTPEVESLIDPILKCLQSDNYLKVFDKIELNPAKTASKVISGTQYLAWEHLFYMRECAEFLFRHDHKRYDEISTTLSKQKLDQTQEIFQKNLSSLKTDAIRRGFDVHKAAQIEALSYHIKFLSHFTQTKSLRQQFGRTILVDQILSIVEDASIGDIPEIKLGIIGQALNLLYNLSYDDDICSKLQAKNFIEICLKFRSSKDRLIFFTSEILYIMLKKKKFEDTTKSDLLSKICLEYIDRSVEEPKQLYQNIKLDGLLKIIKIIIQNDSIFVTSLSSENRDGISIVTKCVYTNHLENSLTAMTQRIHKTAINVIWKLSFYGSKVIEELKKDDLFIERLLILSKENQNDYNNVNRIIWRLGEIKASEKSLDIDDKLISIENEWDETIPYDVIISFSQNVNDIIIAKMITTRLIKKNYRVYFEKASKHRLELMKKAIEKQKAILICLSKSYRSSKVCMSEIEYANKSSCPMIVTLVESKFHIQGWLKHLIADRDIIDFSSKDKKHFPIALKNLYFQMEKYQNLE